VSRYEYDKEYKSKTGEVLAAIEDGRIWVKVQAATDGAFDMTVSIEDAAGLGTWLLYWAEVIHRKG